MKRLFCVYTEWFTQAPLLIFGFLLIVIIDIIVVDIIFVAVVNMIIIIVSSPSTNQKMAYLCYEQTPQFYPTLIIVITIHHHHLHHRHPVHYEQEWGAHPLIKVQPLLWVIPLPSGS